MRLGGESLGCRENSKAPREKRVEQALGSRHPTQTRLRLAALRALLRRAPSGGCWSSCARGAATSRRRCCRQPCACCGTVSAACCAVLCCAVFCIAGAASAGGGRAACTMCRVHAVGWTARCVVPQVLICAFGTAPSRDHCCGCRRYVCWSASAHALSQHPAHTPPPHPTPHALSPFSHLRPTGMDTSGRISTQDLLTVRDCGTKVVENFRDRAIKV